jgi:hypothetical protein
MDALLKRHKSSLERPEYMLAQIASAVYNTGYKLEKQLSPIDFMLSQQGKSKSKTKTSKARVRMSKGKRKLLATNVDAVLMMMTSANK